MTKRLHGGSSETKKAKYAAHPAKLELKKKRAEDKRIAWEKKRKEINAAKAAAKQK